MRPNKNNNSLHNCTQFTHLAEKAFVFYLLKAELLLFNLLLHGIEIPLAKAVGGLSLLLQPAVVWRRERISWFLFMAPNDGIHFII